MAFESLADKLQKKLYVYVEQAEELAAFTEFFMNRFAGKDGKK